MPYRHANVEPQSRVLVWYQYETVIVTYTGYIRPRLQGHMQEFAEGGKQGVWERKSPAGSRGRTPVGPTEAHVDFEIRI